MTYLVNYEANDGIGEQVDEKNPYHENDQVVILGQGDLKRNGYQFVGWNTQCDGKGKTYLEKDTFIMPSHNITLYAMWQKNVSIDVDKPKDSVSTNQVQTSDNNEIVLLVSLMILACITGIFVTKSLKKNR